MRESFHMRIVLKIWNLQIRLVKNSSIEHRRSEDSKFRKHAHADCMHAGSSAAAAAQPVYLHAT
jgi:hypothetical protein